MKDFKRGGGGGGFRGNRDDRGGRPSFGGSRGGFGGRGGDNRGSRGGFDGPKQMFEATCSNCGKRCEVPFRPTGEKPVYCRDCFNEREGGGSSSYNKDSRREVRSEARDTRIDDIKRQLDAINVKLDQLLGEGKKSATNGLRFTEELKAAEDSKKKTDKKSVKKKASKKKK